MPFPPSALLCALCVLCVENGLGNLSIAIAPTSVMTMEITPAKIGRSMKKWVTFIEGEAPT